MIKTLYTPNKSIATGASRFAILSTIMLLVLALLTPLRAHADTSYTLWDDSVTPGTVDFNDTGAYELGLKFQPTVDGQITGVRFYKSSANTGTHIGNLWSAGGTNLASVTFSGETSSGWQEATFSSPVSVTADTTYVVSYWDPNGHYSADDWYFVNSFTNEPLVAQADISTDHNGVYNYGSDSFPTTSYQAANYWVEPVFTTSNSIPSQPTPPSYPSGSVNLFGTATPSTTSASDSYTVNVAMRFQVQDDGKIYGVRFYKGSGNDGAHVGFLWNYDTATYLGGVRFDNETSSGWQEAVFPTPIDVTSGTNYMIDYIAPHGHYAVDGSYFTSDRSNNGIMPWYTSAPGSTNGWYDYSSGINATTPSFPSNSYNNSNYWVDPIYKAN